MPPENGQRQPSKPKPREWEVELVEPVVEDGQVVGVQVDREGSHQLFADVEAILFRMGGAALIGAKREQLEDGTYVTTGYKVSVESFMPAVARAPQVNMGLGAQPPSEEVRDTPPDEPVAAVVFCGKTEGCELPDGHEGDCISAPPPASAVDGVPEAEIEPAAAD